MKTVIFASWNKHVGKFTTKISEDNFRTTTSVGSLITELVLIVWFNFSEDKTSLSKLIDTVRTNYNERFDEVGYDMLVTRRPHACHISETSLGRPHEPNNSLTCDDETISSADHLMLTNLTTLSGVSVTNVETLLSFGQLLILNLCCRSASTGVVRSWETSLWLNLPSKRSWGPRSWLTKQRCKTCCQ